MIVDVQSFAGSIRCMAPGESAGDRRGAGAERPRAAARSLRALIVEDELLVAWHLEAILENLGHEVCAIAPTPDGAMKAMGEWSPDLVLMDVNLGPGLSGIDVARAILALGATPIVFVTAYGDERIRSAIREAAPHAVVLSKPVNEEDLERGIAAVTVVRH